MTDRIEAICDLLLAAAHSDKRFADSEKQMITKMMCAVQRTEHLAPELQMRIATRNPDDIDVMETASVFENDSEEDKRHLMQLIAAVHMVDGDYDLEEDEMTIFVAAALGFNSAQIHEISQALQEEAPRSGEE